MTYRELAIYTAVVAVAMVACTVIAIATDYWLGAVLCGIGGAFLALRAWQFYRAGQEHIR